MCISNPSAIVGSDVRSRREARRWATRPGPKVPDATNVPRRKPPLFVVGSVGVTPHLCVVDALAISQEGTDDMASSSKKKTTMKKMNREMAVRERQLRKQEKKEARKQAAAEHPGEPSEVTTGDAP
jgi:hypothetical protein